MVPLSRRSFQLIKWLIELIVSSSDTPVRLDAEERRTPATAEVHAVHDRGRDLLFLIHFLKKSFYLMKVLLK